LISMPLTRQSAQESTLTRAVASSGTSLNTAVLSRSCG
jgi:hypothetical protein